MGHAMGGGAPGSTTEHILSPTLQKFSDQYLNALGNLVMPGGQPAQSPLPYQQVAPLMPQQMQGMNLAARETYGPQAGAGPLGPGIDTNQILQGMLSSPYWQQHMTPALLQAFSLPALNQVNATYQGAF